MENEPYEPAVPACARKVAGLSTSLMVRVPEVEMSAAASVSVRLAVAAERTAASLVPAMLMVTAVMVPSAAATAEESAEVESAANSVWGVSAVEVQAPAAARERDREGTGGTAG